MTQNGEYKTLSDSLPDFYGSCDGDYSGGSSDGIPVTPHGRLSALIIQIKLFHPDKYLIISTNVQNVILEH